MDKHVSILVLRIVTAALLAALWVAGVRWSAPSQRVPAATGTMLAPPPAVPAALVAEPRFVPVLMYHAIRNQPGNPATVPPARFAEQMAFLWRAGFHVVTMTALVDYLTQDRPLPPRPIVITFDDGYADTVTQALPVLSRYDFPATLFLVGDAISPQRVSKQGLAALRAAGWDIASHTLHHVVLTQLSPPQAEDEIARGLQSVQAAVDGQALATVFAYPYGARNPLLETYLRTTGVQLAFTSDAGWVRPGLDLLALPRVYVGPAMSLEEFSRRVNNPNYAGGDGS